jgi:hypothetical protein
MEPALYDLTAFTAATTSVQFAVELHVTKELRILKVTLVSVYE